jgi:protein PET117
MSRAAKLTLVGTSLFALGTIAFVHHAQQAEKAVCPLSTLTKLQDVC